MNPIWLAIAELGRLSEAALTEEIGKLAERAPWGQVQGAGVDRFCRVVGRVLQDENGAGVELANMYDVRVFGPTVELHALRRGDLWEVVVAEDHDHGVTGAVKLERGTYDALIWGTSAGIAGDAPGWSFLASARVGGAAVPVETDDRAVLETVEYRGHTDVGSAYLAYSRIAEIKPLPRKVGDFNG